ncbi:MAG: lipoyl synthase [Microbacter sp.]
MPHFKKPDWLKTSFSADGAYAQVKQIVDDHHLHTICTSGRCPNISDCWSRGTATMMILGDICTRNCRFCNTITGKPLPPSEDEPEQVANSIHLMKLQHAVITSVDRDDLPDLGANHWARTIQAIKVKNPSITLEVLIPDFQGRTDLLDLVIDAQPDIISHNLETVRRLTPVVRSAAKYEVSLSVLHHIAQSGIVAKSGLMVGLGETREEMLETMDDLLKAGCTVLTIGQYLQPSRKNMEVAEYVTPEQFEQYRISALAKGFAMVESAPLVRSSYHAEKHIAATHRT